MPGWTPGLSINRGKIRRMDATKRNIWENNSFALTRSASQSWLYNAIQYAGQNGVVRKNVFYNNAGGGVHFQVYSDEALYNYGNHIYHNTFYNNSCYALYASNSADSRYHDNSIVNNLLYNNHDCAGANNQTYIGNQNAVSWINNLVTMENPGFVNVGENNFNLTSSSGAVNSGFFLARTTGAGSGTSMRVNNVLYFYDGFDILGELGDLIQIDGQTTTARIVDINYATNTLVLDRSLSWTAGQGVSLAYSDSAPDIGAYEYTGSTPLPTTCSGTNTSCGTYPNCNNCNNQDGCSGTTYRDYYCSNNSCAYTSSSNDSRCVTACTENWSCTSWSACSNSTQTRICTDVNSCGTTANKPTESQSCTVAPSPPSPTGGIPTDYIGYWKFDGNANDETGNSNGTINGNPQFVSGAQDRAIDFDGTYGQYVDAGEGDNLTENKSGLTVIGWLYKRSADDSRAGLMRQLNVATMNFRKDSSSTFIVYNSAGSPGSVSVNLTSYTDQWAQVAVTYDGSYVRAYLNGSGIGIPAVLSGLTANNTSNIEIGRDPAYSGSINGRIDNVMIYDRALTAQEIQNIYDAQKPGSVGKAEPEEMSLSGLASILNAIQEAIEKLKELF